MNKNWARWLLAGVAGAWTGCALGAEGEAAEVTQKKGAREEFAAGERAYDKGEFQEAAAAFRRAAEGASAEGLDGDVARFNALVAAEQGGDAETEEALLGERPGSPDVGLQAQMHFNRGNAWMKRAMAARESSGGGDAGDAGEGAVVAGGGMEEAARAVEEYREAVLRDATNTVYKQNCELGMALLEQILQEQMQQQQQQEQQQEKKEDGEQEEQQQEGQQGEGEQQEQEQQQAQGQEGDEGEEQEGQEQQEGEQGAEEQQKAQEGEPQEEMEEREAEALMDLMKDKEQAQREKLRVRLGRPVPVEKDW